MFKRKQRPEYVLDYLYCDKCGSRIKLNEKTKKCDSCDRLLKDIAAAASGLSKKQFATNYFTANSMINKSYKICWLFFAIMLVGCAFVGISNEAWFVLAYFGAMSILYGIFLIISQITHKRLFLIPAIIFSLLGLFGLLLINLTIGLFLDLKMFERDYKAFIQKTNEMKAQ